MDVILWKLKVFGSSTLLKFLKMEENIRPKNNTNTGSKVINIFFKNKLLEEMVRNKIPKANTILHIWPIESNSMLPPLFSEKEAKITKTVANKSLILIKIFEDKILVKKLDIPDNVKWDKFLFLVICIKLQIISDKMIGIDDRKFKFFEIKIITPKVSKINSLIKLKDNLKLLLFAII